MPRNISFALTTDHVRRRIKTVTRRYGWLHAKPGDVLWAVEKSQGLKKGEKVKRICQIRITSVVCQPLSMLLDHPDYGRAECIREGFPPPHEKSDPRAFVEFFVRTHKHVTIGTPLTRIEFEYIDAVAEAA